MSPIGLVVITSVSLVVVRELPAALGLSEQRGNMTLICIFVIDAKIIHEADVLMLCLYCIVLCPVIDLSCVGPVAVA